MKLTPPVRTRQNGDEVWASTHFILAEKASHGGLQSEHLEEVSDDFDVGYGHGVTASSETQVVGSGERLISGDVLIGAALRAQFFKGIRRISGARPATTLRRRSDPDKLVRIRKR